MQSGCTGAPSNAQDMSQGIDAGGSFSGLASMIPINSTSDRTTGDINPYSQLGNTNSIPPVLTGITGTQNNGSGSAHNNLQPYRVLNYIIKT